MTHGHPTGYLSAAYFASRIFDVSRGVELEDAMDLAGPMLMASPGHEEMARVIAAVRAAAPLGAPTHDTVERIGGGWTGRSRMNTAKTVDESDDEGVVHVDVPVGGPGRRVEVVVTWQDVDGPAAVDGGEDWSDLFGILEDIPLERGPQRSAEGSSMSDLVGLLEGLDLQHAPQGEYEKRDPVG